MKNKVAIIVGVGPGMGIALSRRFGKEGFKIAMIARKQEMLEKYQQELAGESIESKGYPCDVKDEEQLRLCFRKIKEELGNMHLLIYNVSVLRSAKPSELAVEDLMEDFKINVAGVLVASQEALKQMKDTENGCILITGGGLAINPYFEYASLGVGKAGIRNLSASIHQEYRKYGIKVASIIIDGMIEKGTHFDPDKIAEEFWKTYSGSKYHAELIYD